LLVPVVDTLALEHRRRRRHHHLDDNASLRLPDLRDAYGLPQYSAHDCLVDAIATAELMLAIAAHHRSATLGDVLG
jgi:DNA polymerase-3 subunit epsilon